MSLNVLICDDSSFARRQMARAIPEDWDVNLHYAENGEQALALIRAGKVDLTFLDLNMPVLDGYQTMAQIREHDLPTMVIVVSGDVQAQARERMKAMGALDFIAKPVDTSKLSELLRQYGIHTGSGGARQIDEQQPLTHIDPMDAYREMANVAMGQAGERLAKLLGEFINLPIPNVNLIESSELRMAIAEIQHKTYVSAVSQGFISPGINGEALVIFNETNFASLVSLLKYSNHGLSEQHEIEALMDVSNILIGACLNALAEQLNVRFSQNHPIILGRHCDLDQLLKNSVSKWKQIVAIEIGYSIEHRDINFDLLLLFPKESMDVMFNKLVSVNEGV